MSHCSRTGDRLRVCAVVPRHEWVLQPTAVAALEHTRPTLRVRLRLPLPDPQKDILNLVYLCRSYNLNEVADYWEQVCAMGRRVTVVAL